MYLRGTTLAHLSPILKDWSDKNLVGEELIGANIVEVPLTAPLMRIAENAGSNGAVIAENVKSKPFNDGFNAASGEYVDMSSAGIVDPKSDSFRITKCCLYSRDGLDY